MVKTKVVMCSLTLFSSRTLKGEDFSDGKQFIIIITWPTFATRVFAIQR